MKIKAGIIGISTGNGHPYYFSAIVNGYNEKEMSKCRFEVIPKYLQLYKNKPLNDNFRITHLWTQNKKESSQIAKSAKIPNISNSIKELVRNVDCIIFARDDRTLIKKFSKFLFKTKKPVFVDKPIATSKRELKYILSRQAYINQVFSASFTRYCKETNLSKKEFKSLGKLKLIKCAGPKNTRKYLIHLVDPIVNNFCQNKKIISIKKNKIRKGSTITVLWSENFKTIFTTTGLSKGKFQYSFIGSRKTISKKIENPYIGFKKLLIYFYKNMYKNVFAKEHKKLFKIISILDV